MTGELDEGEPARKRVAEETQEREHAESTDHQAAGPTPAEHHEPPSSDAARPTVPESRAWRPSGEPAEQSREVTLAQDTARPDPEAREPAERDSPVVWVNEGSDLRAGPQRGMSQRAFDYQIRNLGARSNVERGRSETPALRYTRENGTAGQVRFDGVEDRTLIDRKLSIYSSKKTENQIGRQSRAAEQNGMDVRWEVPTQKEADRAERLIARVGARNITVRVVPE